jgi:arginase family enzyme
MNNEQTRARYGPRAIREGSQIYGIAFWSKLGVYDVELEGYRLADTKIVDYGDTPVLPT